MVIINSCTPQTLNAYSTSPLTSEMARTVQHGFYDGTIARYGNPVIVVNIHDRPELHGISHYDIRNVLDGEGQLDPFLIVDDRTPDLDAVWYVTTTQECKYNSDPTHFAHPPITYPDEEFVLWQAHIRTSDVPIDAVSWDVGCGSMEEAVQNRYDPYDPHSPQENIIRSNIDWADPKTAASMWGFVYLKANWSEVEWSTDPNDRKGILPRPPVVVRLTADAARESGLLQQWSPKQEVPPTGEEVALIAKYDWASPLWPTGYPDDPLGLGANTTLHLPKASVPVNGSREIGSLSFCSRRQLLSQNSCPRLQRQQAWLHNVINTTSTT